MRRQWVAMLVAVVIPIGSSGCGCDAFGSPAVMLRLLDARTRTPLTFSETRVAYEPSVGGPTEFRRPLGDTTSAVRLCCEGGRWRIQVERAGYAPVDTSFVVDTQGHCDRPVLRTVVLALQTAAPLGGAP